MLGREGSMQLDRIEQACLDKGLRMTDQRRVIARVLSSSHDHPDVEELYRRAVQVDPHISIATVYRTVRLFEEAGISVGRVSYLASQPWAFPSSLMIGCAGDATSREITIDPSEIEDARWFPREEILQALAGQHPMLLPARNGAIAHFLLRNWLADTLD